MSQKKFNLKLILAVGLALVSGACGTAQNKVQPGGNSLEARIEQVENGLVKYTILGRMPLSRKYNLAERMENYQVPGVGIAVIEDFQIDWAKGYGVRVAGGNEPITSQTLFNAGSIVKMFAAAGALSLVETGSLNLDQDVNEKLVSWQVPENEFTTTEKVTLRRLLSHSGGIQDGFTNRSGSDVAALPGYLSPEGETPVTTIQELLEAAPGIDVDGPTRVGIEPGSLYAYANADYAILELLLVDVTGKPFPKFMTETILEPLNLSSSTFEKPLPTELRARASWEHYANGEPFENERLHFPFGTLWSSPSDLAGFAIEIIQAYNGHSNMIISQAMAQEMLTAQIDLQGNQMANAYGFGFDLDTEKVELIAFHTGGTWGSTCIVWLYPESGRGAVVMTNSASGSLIRYEILASISKAYGWP